MLWLSLLALLVSCVMTAWLNLSSLNSVIFSAAVVLVFWQALLKKALVTARFKSECGEDWAQDDALGEMLEALISRAQGMVDKQQDVQHVKQACRAQRTGAPAEAPATANGHKGLRVAVFV